MDKSGHSVLCIGFKQINKKEGYLVFQNSSGKKFGDDGKFRLHVELP